jgi:hypothetical protein
MNYTNSFVTEQIKMPVNIIPVNHGYEPSALQDNFQ